MNKKLSALLGTILIASSAFAAQDTKKTELVMRDHRHRAAAFTSFHELAEMNRREEETKSATSLMGFFHESNSVERVGKVFGAQQCGTGACSTDASGCATTCAADCGTASNCIRIGTKDDVAASNADVENNFLLHYYTPTPNDNTLKGTLCFNPKHTAYGTRLDTFINLNKILDGLYFKTNILVLNVKNDLGVTVYNEKKGAYSGESFGILDILSGKTLTRNGDEAAKESNQQEPLHYAKICGSHSKAGIGDIESMLGWRFLNEEKYYVGINVAWHVPTGDRPSGEYLWEPRYGNRHWTLGAGLEGSGSLWKEENQSLKISSEVHYRYLFEDYEKRTLGLKCLLTEDCYKNHIFSHYYLLGEKNRFGIFPAANVLTRDVDVTPGSQVDAFLAINYNYSNLTINLGYNFFWKEEETVKLRTATCCESCFTDERYAISSTDHIANDLLEAKTETVPAGTYIAAKHIDVSVAQTPEIMTHSVFAGIGYLFKDWNYPALLGIGGSYEFGHNKASADSYTLWAKLGLTF